MKIPSLIALLAAICTCIALPVMETSAVVTPVAPQTIYQFSSNILPENLYLRANGQLLLTANSVPKIFQVDPSLGPSQQARVVHTFPHVESVFGIVQLSTDYFAVAVGNFSLTDGATPGSWSIWTVDLGNYQSPTYDASKVVVKEVVTPLSKVQSYDGLVILNSAKGLLASSDPTAGTIWTIDIINNHVTTLVTSKQLQGVSGSMFNQVGVNGLKIKKNNLYYTVTGRDTLGVIPVNLATGQATGSLTTVFDYGIHLDDFNIAQSGNFYLSTLDTKNGGILRRSANTQNGQNGTSLVISQYGTNSVFPVDSYSGCTVYFTAALVNRVLKATLSGPC